MLDSFNLYLNISRESIYIVRCTMYIDSLEIYYIHVQCTLYMYTIYSLEICEYKLNNSNTYKLVCYNYIQ